MIKLIRIELENFKGELVETFTSMKEFNRARKLDYEKYQGLYDYYVIEFNGQQYALTPNQLHGNEFTDNDELDTILAQGVNLWEQLQTCL